jgi:hypothetical protein
MRLALQRSFVLPEVDREGASQRVRVTLNGHDSRLFNAAKVTSFGEIAEERVLALCGGLVISNGSNRIEVPLLNHEPTRVIPSNA